MAFLNDIAVSVEDLAWLTCDLMTLGGSVGILRHITLLHLRSR
jgi:hypothetical protein